LDSLIPKIPC